MPDIRRLRRPIALIAGFAATGLVAPLSAQDGGLSGSLSVNQSLVYEDNPDLSVGGGDGEFLSRTALGFSLSSATRTQSLSFSTSTAFETDGTTGRFDAPLLRFGYNTESANSGLTATARLRQADVDSLFFAPLTEEDPEEETPVEQDLLVSDGQRRDIDVSLGFDTGRTTPVGLAVSLDHRSRDFIDVEDPDYYDTVTTTAAGRATLEVDPRITLSLNASQTVFTAEDDDDTERVTTTAGANADLAVNQVLTASIGVSADRVETEQSGVTSVSEGLGASIGVVRDMPNGTLGADLSSRVAAAGRRTTFDVSRAMELPGATLSYSVGVTQTDDLPLRPVGSLNYSRELRHGDTLQVNVTARAQSSADDDETIVTRIVSRYQTELGTASTLNAGLTLTNVEVLEGDGEDRGSAGLRLAYVQEINTVSSWSAEVNLATVTGADDQQRGDVTLGYERELTRDWSFQSSVSHTVVDTEGEGRASSNAVSLGVGRTFEFRP